MYIKLNPRFNTTTPILVYTSLIIIYIHSEQSIKIPESTIHVTRQSEENRVGDVFKSGLIKRVSINLLTSNRNRKESFKRLIGSRPISLKVFHDFLSRPVDSLSSIIRWKIFLSLFHRPWIYRIWTSL